MPEEMYNNNGVPYAVTEGAETEATDATDDDAVLMYQAKLNVKDKQNLKRHIIAFLIAIPVLAFVHLMFFDNHQLHNVRSNQHQQAVEILSAVHQLDTIVVGDARLLFHDMVFIVEDLWYNNRVYRSRADWGVLMGAMLFWGGWITFRIFKRIRPLIKIRRIPATKPDPVLLEFNRLKNR